MKLQSFENCYDVYSGIVGSYIGVMSFKKNFDDVIIVLVSNFFEKLKMSQVLYHMLYTNHTYRHRKNFMHSPNFIVVFQHCLLIIIYGNIVVFILTLKTKYFLQYLKTII